MLLLVVSAATGPVQSDPKAKKRPPQVSKAL